MKKTKTLQSLIVSFALLLVSCQEILDNLDDVENSCANGITVTDLQQRSSNSETCRGSNVCTLTGAIGTANFCIDEEVTITLQQNAIYLFDSTNTNSALFFNNQDSTGNSALPTITSNIIIEGNGATLERATGATDNFRFFHVAKGASLTLKNLTLKNGNIDAGILDFFLAVKEKGNNGGAVYTEGKLILENCTFEGNKAYLDGGAIYATETSDLFIRNSSIVNNQSFDTRSGTGTPGGGGGIYTRSDTIFIEKTIFVRNKSTASGAAISMGNPAGTQFGTATISQCLFEENEATRHGGAIYGGRLAGVFGVNNIFMDSTTIATSLVIENTTFTGNLASRGGAFYSAGDYAYLKHVTLLDNNATSEGSDVNPEGGGFHSEAGPVPISFNFENCIINNGVGGDFGGTAAAFASNFTGVNFVGDIRVVGTRPNILTGNPQLSPLTGTGYQRGYVPSAGSPLIDAGSSAGCLTEDQRGNPRPVGAGCDLGAIEKQ